MAPPPWATPPAAPGAPAAPAGPPPAPPAPPAYPGAPTPYYPVTPTPAAAGKPIATVGGIKVTPKLLAIGGIAVAAVVVVILFVANGSKGSGSITFTPSTVSCSSPVTFTATVVLPSSVHAGDTITITLDGKTVGTNQMSVDSTTVQQADGSWTVTSPTSAAEMQSLCAAGGSVGGFNILTPGTHTEQVLDSTGKVLAQGSYTVKP